MLIFFKDVFVFDAAAAKSTGNADYRVVLLRDLVCFRKQSRDLGLHGLIGLDEDIG